MEEYKFKPCPWCFNLERFTVIEDYSGVIKPIWLTKYKPQFLNRQFCVFCEKCGCTGPKGETRKMAVDKWNWQDKTMEAMLWRKNGK